MHREARKSKEAGWPGPISLRRGTEAGPRALGSRQKVLRRDTAAQPTFRQALRLQCRVRIDEWGHRGSGDSVVLFLARRDCSLSYSVRP